MSRVDKERIEYLTALQEQIEKQLEQNHHAIIMDVNPKTGQLEERDLNESEALKRMNKLQLEIDALEGLAWWDRHHKGLAAVVAAAVRAVVDMVSRLRPEYREMVKAVTKQEISKMEQDAQAEKTAARNLNEREKEERMQKREREEPADSLSQEAAAPTFNEMPFEPEKEQAPAGSFDDRNMEPKSISDKMHSIEEEAIKNEEGRMRGKNEKYNLPPGITYDAAVKENFVKIRRVPEEYLTPQIVAAAIDKRMDDLLKMEAEEPNAAKCSTSAIWDVIRENPAAYKHISEAAKELNMDPNIARNATWPDKLLVKIPQVAPYLSGKDLERIQPGAKSHEYMVKNLTENLERKIKEPESKAAKRATDFKQVILQMPVNEKTMPLIDSLKAEHEKVAGAPLVLTQEEIYKEIGRQQAHGMSREDAVKSVTEKFQEAKELLVEEERTLDSMEGQNILQDVPERAPQMDYSDALSQFANSSFMSTDYLPKDFTNEFSEELEDMQMEAEPVMSDALSMESGGIEASKEEVVPETAPVQEETEQIMDDSAASVEEMHDIEVMPEVTGVPSEQKVDIADQISSMGIEDPSLQDKLTRMVNADPEMAEKLPEMKKDDLLLAGIGRAFIEAKDIPTEDRTPQMNAYLILQNPEAVREMSNQELSNPLLVNTLEEYLVNDRERVTGLLSELDQMEPGKPQQLAWNIREQLQEYELPEKVYSEEADLANGVATMMQYMPDEKYKYMNADQLVSEAVRTQFLEMADIPEDERTPMMYAASLLVDMNNIQNIPEDISNKELAENIDALLTFEAPGVYSPDHSASLDFASQLQEGYGDLVDIGYTLGDYASEGHNPVIISHDENTFGDDYTTRPYQYSDKDEVSFEDTEYDEQEFAAAYTGGER